MAPKAKKEKTAAETREEGRAASKKQAAEDVEGFTPEDEDLSSDEKTPKAKKSGAAAYREYKSQQGYLALLVARWAEAGVRHVNRVGRGVSFSKRYNKGYKSGNLTPAKWATT